MFVSQGWQLLTTFFLYVRILKSAIRQSHYGKGDSYLTFNKSVINKLSKILDTIINTFYPLSFTHLLVLELLKVQLI